MTVGFSKTEMLFEISDSEAHIIIAYSNMQSLVGFLVIPICVTLNDL